MDTIGIAKYKDFIIKKARELYPPKDIMLISLFGSRIRDDFIRTSDWDILVSFKNLLDLNYKKQNIYYDDNKFQFCPCEFGEENKCFSIPKGRSFLNLYTNELFLHEDEKEIIYYWHRKSKKKDSRQIQKSTNL